MLDLEKNRVYDIGEIETLKSTAVSLLSTGIDACISWDYSITELNTLQSQTPVKSGQLSSALSSAGTLYQSDYDVEKCWIDGALTNIITNIPAQDAAGVQLLEPLSENLQLIMGMIEDLAGCIEAAGTNLSLSEFQEKIEGVKQDWDNSTLIENLQEFETSFIGMLENTCYGADPVNMSTGNFVYRYTDLSTGGEQPLTFVRTYNAMSRHKGILGRCWSHNWEKCLKEKDNKLVLYHEDGRQETFVPEDTSGQIETERTEEKTARVYVSSLNRQAKIIQNREGKSLSVTGEGIFEYYDKDGYLFLLEDNKNSQTILEYEEDRLVRVYKKTGEELRFSYGDKDRLVEVRDHTGRTIHFSYEGKKLVKAEDPEGNAFTYEYGENGRISRILDKRNVPVLENEYDDYRRVLLQRFPDGGELRFDYQDKKKAVRLTEQNGSITTYVHDRKFRSKKTIFEDGYEEWEYDAEGRVKRKRDKNGNETFHAYDEKGRPTETTDPLGNKTTKTYDGRGRLTEILHPDGTKTSYAYDEKGRPVRMVNQEGEATLLSYENGESRPSHVTYADGSTMQLTYDAKGNILSIQYPDGTGMSYTYDALSRVTEAVDGNGNTTRIEYDGLDRIKGVKRADGARQSLTYNPMGEAVRIEDFDGYVSTWEYNEINKPVLYVDKQGRKTLTEYDKMWNVSRVTDPEGGITEYAYDKQKRLIQVKDPLGRAVRFAYDGNGNRTKVLYPDDTCMQYEYDALNRVVKETDRAGRTTLTEYDVMGNVSCTTDNAGNKTLYAYDACNRKIKETDRSGAVTEYTYTPLGKTDRILHSDGRMEQYHYGPGGRLDKQDKGDGTWESFTYDRNGNLTKKCCQDGRTYTYTYDCLNRVTEICLNGKPQKTYAYDAMGNITSVKDAAGRETRYQYSPMGKLLAITDAMGNRVFYSYNGRDELTGILQMEKDGKSEFLIPEEDRALLDEDWIKIKKHNEENHDLHLTLLTRDQAGQITKMTDAFGREDIYEYDCMGNVRKRTDQNGEEILWEYHADGQVSSITYPGGKKAVYAYDALARLSRIQDWLGETIFTYDKEGNLTESKDHNGQVMTYTYTPAGKRECVCYPDGSSTEYGYDAMGRVENIQCGALSLTYGYDEWGHLSLCKRSNGILTKLNYDTEGRITDLIHEDENGILEAFHCGYDLTGNRTYLKRESSEEEYSFHKTYEYDSLDRLVTIKEDGNTAASFVYDGYGNRIKECWYKNGQALSEEPQIRALSYNALNQLTEDGQNRYTYDVKGNLTEVKGSNGTVRRMTYDANGCLMELYENEKLIQTNEYNGAGIRTESIFGDNRTAYVADYDDPYHRTAVEYGENERGRNYLWHDNTLLGIPNEGIHVLSDLFHSPVRITDKERTTQNLYAYDEYGTLKSQKETLPLSFGYTGYRKESVSNLYFAGSREYNVESGRFLSKDSYRYMDYEDPSSLNLYAYAKANPLKYLDYDGHECIEEKSYLEKSLEMIILGDYSDEVTGLGLLGSVALGVLGLDFPADIRDLSACFTVNFDPSDPMWWLNLAGCAAAFLPLVGGLKFLDEGAELVKYSDEAVEAAGDVGKHLDEAVEGGTDVIETVSKTNPFDLQPTHSPTLSKNKMNALMDDIKVNGIQEPIKYVEYNGQMYVVDGHHRLLAAKRLGLTEVPIEKVDLPYAGYNTIDDLLWFE